MKFLLALAALVSINAFSQQAEAQASYNNISVGVTSGRLFLNDRTDSTVGCTIRSGYTTCTTGMTRVGWNPNGYACCTYRAEGTEEVVTQEATLADAFDSSRTTSFWGYVSSSNRSPGGGRTAQAPAKLDVCMGSANVDSYTASMNDCYSACDDSSKNGYCTNSGYNNGSSTTAAVCKDRCDCVLGGTCESL